MRPGSGFAYRHGSPRTVRYQAAPPDIGGSYDDSRPRRSPRPRASPTLNARRHRKYPGTPIGGCGPPGRLDRRDLSTKPRVAGRRRSREPAGFGSAPTNRNTLDRPPLLELRSRPAR
jgi:hypothetical protein